MNIAISLGLVVLGVVLIILGLEASDSFGSDMHRLFEGGPTDRTVWLLAGGIAAVAIGGFGALRGGRRS